MLKVLILGNEPEDFTVPLVKGLKERYPLEIDILQISKEVKEKNLKNSIFDSAIPPIKNISKWKLMLAFFNKVFFVNWLNGRPWKDSLKIAAAYNEYRKLFSKYDVVNLHMINHLSLFYLPFISPKSKIIYSFWGTDLLNPPAISRELTSKYIENADTIFLHTTDLREIFLARFGRQYFKKISISLLTTGSEMLHIIPNQLKDKKEILAKYKELNNLESSTILMSIGHSAHHIDNHLELLKALGKLEEQKKNRLFLIIPMTYGNFYKDYPLDVQKEMEKQGFKGKVITKYMSNEEILELRIISEIHLRAPKYDAFSMSLTETLCAENIVISGSWLPYSKYRLNQVYHEEIESSADIVPQINNAIDNFEELMERAKGNAHRLKRMFEKEDIVENYMREYES